MVPYAVRPPVGGVAITSVVLGVASAAAAASVLLAATGPREGLVHKLAGASVIVALTFGAIAVACAVALFMRRRIEWVGGTVLAVVGALLGLVGAAGSVAVFLIFRDALIS